MLRGYRGIIFAVVGWVALSAQHPNPTPTPKPEQGNTDSRVDDSLSNIAATYRDEAKRAARSPERQPCGPNQYESSDDLCAQWKAADAAADAAKWARVSGLLSIVGLLGVAGALILTTRSNNIARDTARNQLRAYLSWDSVDMDFHRDHLGIVENCRFKVRWKNGGQTPAIEYMGDANWTLVSNALPHDFEYPSSVSDVQDGKLVIGPQGIVATVTSRKMSLADFRSVASKERRAFVWAWVQYADTFGERRRSEVAFEMVAEKLPDGDHAVAFEACGPHNGVDDGCLKKRE